MKIQSLRNLLALSMLCLAQAAFGELYRSTSVIQIHPLHLAADGKLDPDYMKNEIARITSDESLTAAAKLLKIDLKKDKDALSHLKKKVSTSPVRGTDLIEVHAESENPKEARRIVNATVRSFIKLRKEEEKERAEAALKAMNKELKRNQELVAKLRSDLIESLKTHGISAEQKKEGPKAVKSLELLKEADPIDKLRVAASIAVAENPVSLPYRNYQIALEDHDFLRKSFGERHRETLRTQLQAVAARAEAEKAVDQLIVLLKDQAKKDAAPKNEVVESSLRHHEFTQTQEDLANANSVLQDFRKRVAESAVIVENLRNPVSLHQKATIPSRK